ncbi:MAG: type II secretion system F family protein, partial [Paenibacillaceae bacterium]|nr:type II secretion system F family protein [Paenibacillaceae bacterium]
KGGVKMLLVKYEAVNAQGKVKRGKIQAVTVDIAETQLRNRGYTVTKYEVGKPSLLQMDVSLGGQKFSKLEMASLCRQLATLYSSRIDIARALEMMAQMATKLQHQQMLYDLLDFVRKGKPLSSAMSEFPTVFDEMVISMVRAGEASGKMEEMLNNLADFYDRSVRIAGKIKGVLFYPLTILAFAFVAIVILMVYVIPNFEANFAQLGAELPLITKIVMGISEWVRAKWYIVIALVSGLVATPFVMRKFPMGLYIFDLILLRLPVFGALVQKQAVLRFCTVFGTLFGAAVPITETLRIVSSVTGNELMNDVIRKSEEEVRVGRSLIVPYQQSSLFPQMLTQMMAIGEKSGTLDIMLKKITKFYEEDVDRTIGRIQSMIEPILIIFIACIVGFIVMSILMPQLQLIQDFQKQ